MYYLGGICRSPTTVDDRLPETLSGHLSEGDMHFWFVLRRWDVYEGFHVLGVIAP